VGFLLTIYLILQNKNGGGHTPPAGFIISLMMIFLAILFLIIDFIFKRKSNDYYLHLNTNIISISINLIIVIFTIAN